MRRNVAPTTSSRNASVLNKSLAQFLLIGAVLIMMGVCGYWLLFTQFMVYDDEGYVLWSLHNYFQEGGLYTKVYSQYGPFIYTLYYGIHTVFDLRFDNEVGRILTLGYWIGASSLTGLFVWRHTRNAISAAAAMALTFGCLLVMINEPIHPGGIISLLVALGAVGGAIALEKSQPISFAILAGIIGSAMVLTKINVGAFFIISAGSWMAINWGKPKLARASLWLAAIGSLLVPFWLMKTLWPEPWVAIFAMGFSCAALALVLLIEQNRRPQFSWSSWRYFVGVAVIVSAFILILTWARGTSFAMLWQGIVAAPMQQPVVYAHSVKWPIIVPWLTSGMFALALAYHTKTRIWRAPLIASARLVVAIWLFSQVSRGIDNSLTFYSFHYGLPFAWLMVVPLQAGKTTSFTNARLWLAWAFVWQTLHAYPVAGSQMGWGSFLWMPLAAVGIHEALLYWAAQARKSERIIKIAGACAGLGMIGLLSWNLGFVSYQRYVQGEPLNLNGAKHLRLSDDITSVLRILDKNIRQHGDMLYSYPGMFSMNIWSELPTPTAANVTHWFSLLTPEAQQDIIDKLEAEERPVLAVQSYLINYLVHQGFPPRSNLQRYLVQNFTPVFRIDTYQFWVRKGRSVAPLSTAQIHKDEENNTATLSLVTDAIGVAATIEIRGLYNPYNRVITLPSTSAAPWKVTPLRPNNSPATAPIQATTPTELNGITRIELPIPQDRQLPQLDILKVVIRDTSGEGIDTLRFSH